MRVNKCPECGYILTDEMIDANMCWECGKILDESLLDKDTIKEIEKQKEEIDPFLSQNIRSHKMTTGYNFEGHIIRDYLGLVSGENVLGTGFLTDIKASFSDLFGVESETFAHRLKEAKKSALAQMIKNSLELGGNAIIGISYGFLNFSGDMIGISVNGTSVVIEKNESVKVFL